MTSDRNQVEIDLISLCEMKTRYENRLESQNVRTNREGIIPIPIDPITGIRVKSISLPLPSDALSETGKNTLDSGKKPSPDRKTLC